MKNNYDVIVVGAGTAGLMAAIAAAEYGSQVLLIEKNRRAGKKLLLTGGGRCNVTNNRPTEEVIAHIHGNGKFLYSAFSQWDNFDIMAFFEERGVALKEEDHGRVFPVTNQSKTIVEALLNYLKELGVTCIFQTKVEKICHEQQQISGVKTDKGDFLAPAVILATGGRAYTSTGSTGDGYKLAKKFGHTLTPLYPVESPLISNEKFITGKVLQGLALSDIKLTVWNDAGKAVASQDLDLLFTHFGLSGPAALRCSGFINQLLEKQKEVKVTVDCFPQKTLPELLATIIPLLDSKKTTKNALQGWLPERLLAYFLTKLNISDLPAKQLTTQQITAFLELCKAFPVMINKTFPIEKSFVTGGGIQLKEVNPKTMASKIVNGLYFAGELLDIHGFTGGYNITAAFVSGHTAGIHAAMSY
ncbi:MULTISPECIES: NAD(P)/FAD-dependent oxidoreductase [unclassified Enterococcus]|uniref:NAD(P)/FAD-dependent oxidoreductase n=1 Tax=unclassified Enterococcus TaxID=2608891 RepID=UPI002477021B|nr:MULTISPECIES: NAD(P)/FAD-dependent oxidoreductase [unclassified Enterococcus]